MEDGRLTWWGAASGHAALLCGAVAVVFERTTPGTALPGGAAAVELTVTHRDDLLAQSMLFVLSVGFTLVFVAALRAFLHRCGLPAVVAFGAGVTAAALQLVAQAGQIALANAAPGGLDPGSTAALLQLGLAAFTVANLPVATMLAAVAVAALRTDVLPAWLGWLSAVAALAHLLPVAGITTSTGPLVQAGWAATLAYALYAIWLAAAATVMVVRLRGRDRDLAARP